MRVWLVARENRAPASGYGSFVQPYCPCAEDALAHLLSLLSEGFERTQSLFIQLSGAPQVSRKFFESAVQTPPQCSLAGSFLLVREIAGAQLGMLTDEEVAR